MNPHELVWTHDRDTVSVKPVCNNEQCQYRWVCTEDCELIYGIERHGAGYRHLAIEHASGRETWHAMVKSTACAFVDSLEADPWIIPELNETRETFEIGRIAVKPIWKGEEGATWDRVSEPDDREEPARG
ncbi:hypothetical protein [Agromyces sp. NPDC058064]|uniref:hypothetical protein n=1 Tax=Agromyces sp. NPDC058064 TaxID=3346322 RepID=UPI0036DD38A4